MYFVNSTENYFKQEEKSLLRRVDVALGKIEKISFLIFWIFALLILVATFVKPTIVTKVDPRKFFSTVVVLVATEESCLQ